MAAAAAPDNGADGLWGYMASQEDHSAASCLPAPANKSDFLPFARKVSAELEAAHTADPDGKCLVRVGADGLRIDFGRMVAHNLRTADEVRVTRWQAVAHGRGRPASRHTSKKKRLTAVVIPTTFTFEARDIIDWAAATRWTRVVPPAYDPDEEDLMGDPLGDGRAEPVVELACSTAALKCIFRQSFITRALDSNPTCCSCGFKFTTPGAQPSGTMAVRRIRDSCAGFEGSTAGTIVIEYRFPDGVQHSRMPSPGQPYAGTSRTAYLPDNPAIGERALALLVRAFSAGRLFAIGTSVTTGRSNTTVWGGIHHKTNLSGGVDRHGWPDPTFMDRLISECAAAGIMEDGTADSDAATAAREAEVLKVEEPPPPWQAD